MRILVIEDDPMQAEILKENLADEGYAVDSADTGEDGVILAESSPYDLILLDNRLPGKQGFEVCKALRQKNITTPITLMSGCMKDDPDIIKGLDCGADDYLTKPFSFNVLSARIRALIRKPLKTQDTRIRIGSIVLDIVNRQVWDEKKEITLTTKEYAILEYLAFHPNTLISRTELEQHIWNMDLDNNSNIVDQHIKNLRKKLGDAVLIETVRGMGYRLRG